MDRRLGRRRQRLLTLRLAAWPLQDHLNGGDKGYCCRALLETGQFLKFLGETINFQAVINSTITPNMTFTKTSQFFGQWSDVQTKTVYGLGFASEIELNKVSD